MSGIKHETIADIVSEMRDATMNGEYDDSTVNDWADRIEAAAKRELSNPIKRYQINSIGNTMAMSEALKKAKIVIHREIIMGRMKDQSDIEAYLLASDALAAQPRNCERGDCGGAVIRENDKGEIAVFREDER